MLIGLTTTPTQSKSAERVNREYIERVQQAGGIPVLLPPPCAECDIERTLDELFGTLSGIILTGGEDIDPVLYGEERSSQVLDVNPQRDLFEIALARRAYANDYPLFGICRGVQVMNVALGGSLYQDVLADELTSNSHKQEGPYDALTQTVTIQPKTRLDSLLKNSNRTIDPQGYRVNSIHHQAIKDLAPVLQVNAIGEDGVIEGMEDPAKRFFLGVQWHPEYLEEEQVLFDAFCAQAALTF